MIKLIFFDFDGVIVESVSIKTNAFAKLFEDEGDEVVKKVVDYHIAHTGISRFDKIKHIYNNFLNRTISDECFDFLCNKFADLVIDNVIKAPYVKGAIEFLEKYYSRYTCFVVSATPYDELLKIIKQRNLTDYFKGIYGAPQSKLDIVRNILLDERVKSHNALYVGDAMSDYNAAQENKVNFIARINANESIFADVDCIKILDLRQLNIVISNMK
ncbi:Haloacid dehalogenase domain protein hydrolase [Candidatus Magnetobacterium bavaricum]|uniref:phosphoglycolate phosphatase n=1 Tax=Candidatus Magnetobacterium bavaricum TaxID=29290 RepID=A0A0F3GKX7_9BACT|nr:Haloacid dehalogenase domain protein hydrolase [Candidatus Magnetobacterium bavaricum]